MSDQAKRLDTGGADPTTEGSRLEPAAAADASAFSSLSTVFLFKRPRETLFSFQKLPVQDRQPLPTLELTLFYTLQKFAKQTAINDFFS